MSKENVSVVRRSFEAFSRGGVEAVISGGFWSAEIVFDPSETGIPGLGVYRGSDEVRFFVKDDWFRAFPFEEWEIEFEELIDAGGDQVFAVSRQRGRGATSGAGAELELANIFTLRDGEIVRVDLYRDREKALEAAGLSE
jgi:ketosteroid isomerase-like protein